MAAIPPRRHSGGIAVSPFETPERQAVRETDHRLVKNVLPPYHSQRVRPTIEGHKIGSLAITEPDGGSDVANIRTTAKRDGDEYVINGAKTYITSGVRADFVVTAARTGDAGAHGISLVVVEKGTPGF